MKEVSWDRWGHSVDQPCRERGVLGLYLRELLELRLALEEFCTPWTSQTGRTQVNWRACPWKGLWHLSLSEASCFAR